MPSFGGLGFVLLAFAGSSIQLVPDGTLLFHLLLIIAMVALLNATLLRPINRILEERERRTKGRLGETGATLLAVEEKLREYERRLKEARAEGYALMERERAALNEERSRKVGDTKSEIAATLSRERALMEAEVEEAKSKLVVEARTRAAEISRQILRRPLNESNERSQG